MALSEHIKTLRCPFGHGGRTIAVPPRFAVFSRKRPFPVRRSRKTFYTVVLLRARPLRLPAAENSRRSSHCSWNVFGKPPRLSCTVRQLSVQAPWFAYFFPVNAFDLLHWIVSHLFRFVKGFLQFFRAAFWQNVLHFPVFYDMIYVSKTPSAKNGGKKRRRKP